MKAGTKVFIIGRRDKHRGVLAEDLDTYRDNAAVKLHGDHAVTMIKKELIRQQFERRAFEIFKEDGKDLYYVMAGGVWVGCIMETPDGLAPWTYAGQGVSLGGQSLEAISKSVELLFNR